MSRLESLGPSKRNHDLNHSLLFVSVEIFQILETVYVMFFASLIFSDILGKRFEWAELLCLFGHFAITDLGEKAISYEILLEER